MRYLIVGLLLSGCGVGAGGTADTSQDLSEPLHASRIREGMSLEEVVRVAGDPCSTSWDSLGHRWLSYYYPNCRPWAKADETYLAYFVDGRTVTSICHGPASNNPYVKDDCAPK